jgi:hypothetical protein
MLELLTTEMAMNLAKVRDPLCVSLVLPTEHGPEGAKQARLQLKNLIAGARDEVRTHTGALQTDELLAPAEEILADDRFWRDTAQGLAIYLADGIVKVRRVPGKTDAVGLVADRFAITPTLAALVPDTQFRVLALSINHAHVFLGDRHNFIAMRVPDLPDGLEDALWFDKQDNLLNRHGGMHFGSGGRPTSIVHGSNSQRDENLERHSHYFRVLDDALIAEFGQSETPLIVAAVEREIAGFVQHSKLNNVMKLGIVGNPEELTLHELHSQAWALVEPLLERKTRTAEDWFYELDGTGRTTCDPVVLAAAAAGGGVDTLFVVGDPRVWSPDGRAVSIEHRIGDRDLINEAVTDTLTYGGEVFPTRADDETSRFASVDLGVAGILRPGWPSGV